MLIHGLGAAGEAEREVGVIRCTRKARAAIPCLSVDRESPGECNSLPTESECDTKSRCLLTPTRAVCGR